MTKGVHKNGVVPVNADLIILAGNDKLPVFYMANEYFVTLPMRG
jgi:hypothetical protein